MRKIKIETPEMEPLAISQEQAKARYNMGKLDDYINKLAE